MAEFKYKKRDPVGWRRFHHPSLGISEWLFYGICWIFWKKVIKFRFMIVFIQEIAASEFKVQGLEIDYALVGWDGDFKYDKNKKGFICRKFSNAKGEWVSINGQDADIDIRHMINAYRVILTRARQGMVIFVPLGDISCKDKTVLPAEYDDTYNYLKSIGITEIWEYYGFNKPGKAELEYAANKE